MRSALTEGELAVARDELRAARSEISEATSLAKHPALQLARWIPIIDNDARAVDALVRAADEAIGAGIVGTNGLVEVGATEDVSQAFLAGRHVALDKIDQIAPDLARASSILADAEAILTSAEPPHLSALRSRFLEATEEIVGIADSARRIDALSRSLGSVLGGGASRHYLLAFETPSESRGTGGFIGLVGELLASDGRLELERVAPILDLYPDEIPPVEAPDWFERSYASQSSLTQVRQTNLTPTFPVASEVLLRMHEQVTGRALDGVIAMDPIALGLMLRSMSPIEVNGSEPITADNAEQILLRDTYERIPDNDIQNRFLGAVIGRFWKRVAAGDYDAALFAEGIAEAVATQHFKMYVRDPSAQAGLQVAGLTMDHSDLENMQMVFHNNYGANKVDYFLQRRVETEIRLQSDGSADVETSITLENHAPDRGSDILLGRTHKGENRMQINVMLPLGANPDSIIVNGDKQQPLTFLDSDHLIIWDYLEISPGDDATVVVRYEAPGHYLANRYVLTLVPQPMVNPDEHSVAIYPPEAFLMRERFSTGILQGFTRSGPHDRPWEIELEFLPAG